MKRIRTRQTRRNTEVEGPVSPASARDPLLADGGLARTLGRHRDGQNNAAQMMKALVTQRNGPEKPTIPSATWAREAAEPTARPDCREAVA
jgi:hypothetical protein